MVAHPSVKKSRFPSRIVGVIATAAELRAARAMAQPPDLFELRLDHLAPLADKLERTISDLGAPLIITARHPAEGGANNLSPGRRYELLSRFLPWARYIDIELRSLGSLRSLLDEAARARVQRIFSFHHLRLTPSARSLHAKARAAKAQGADVFKVATRTDHGGQLATLINFATLPRMGLPLSVMGMGKLGAVSRIVLAQLGSVFTYAAILEPRVAGQMSVEQLRSALQTLRG